MGHCAYPTGGTRLKLDGVRDKKEEQIAWQGARRIAAWVHQSLNGGPKPGRTGEEKARGLKEQPLPGDFLLLLRYKKYMHLFARALEGWGIPFTMTGGGGIANPAELKELVCLVQALADPDNPLPLVATLRGLFFGMCHKVESVVTLKFFGEGFGFGESANHFQQLYGFSGLFARNNAVTVFCRCLTLILTRTRETGQPGETRTALSKTGRPRGISIPRVVITISRISVIDD